MTKQQKTRALKAHLKEVAGFIPSNQWLKDNLENYEFINGKVYHHLHLPQSQSHNHDIAEPIEIKEDKGESYFSDEPKNEISHTNNETSKELITTPPYTNNETSNANHDSNFDHCSDHLNKINEAVILHHEGIKAFLNKYNDVQVLRAFYFEATDRFLIFCKDLKVKKKHKEEYCLFWWDWTNRITTKTGDYVDCFYKYEILVQLMGNPSPITLPEAPDLTEYYRNVTYCPADGKRCEQFTLALGV